MDVVGEKAIVAGRGLIETTNARGTFTVESLNVQTALRALEQTIAAACPAQCPELVGELERLKAMAWSRMNMAGTGLPSQPTSCAEDLLTIPQVALRLNLSVYRTYELARQGRLRTVKIGKSVRVTPVAVEEFLMRLNGGKAA